jgi:hypothetical protein
MRPDIVISHLLQPVLCFEAQNVFYRDAVQMPAEFPGGKDLCVDELVDCFTTELPALAQLRHRQPDGIDATLQLTAIRLSA